MRPEYDFSKVTRGKYAARYAKGSNVVVLDPELAKLFPDSQSVNDALRALADVADKQVRRRRKGGRQRPVAGRVQLRNAAAGASRRR